MHVYLLYTVLHEKNLPVISLSTFFVLHILTILVYNQFNNENEILNPLTMGRGLTKLYTSFSQKFCKHIKIEFIVLRILRGISRGRRFQSKQNSLISIKIKFIVSKKALKMQITIIQYNYYFKTEIKS